jgi:hypothetical protein
VVSGNGMMPIAGTATISGTGDAVTLKWSDRTFGDVEYHSASTLNLSANNTWNQLIIPSMQFYNADGTVANVTAKIGPIYYLFSDAPLATATNVYYIEAAGNLSSSLTAFEAGKSYGLSKDVKQAGIIKSDGTLSEDQAKTLWINQASAFHTDVIADMLLRNNTTTPDNITLIQANTEDAQITAINSNYKLYAYINNYSTTAAQQCFYYCNPLTYVSLAKVTTLPSGVFYHCENLKEIFLPKVTSIGTDAFSGCASLTKLIFGSIITDTYTDWSSNNPFKSDVDTKKIDVVLKKGQPGADPSGNTLNGLVFRSITFMD